MREQAVALLARCPTADSRDLAWLATLARLQRPDPAASAAAASATAASAAAASAAAAPEWEGAAEALLRECDQLDGRLGRLETTDNGRAGGHRQPSGRPSGRAAGGGGGDPVMTRLAGLLCAALQLPPADRAAAAGRLDGAVAGLMQRYFGRRKAVAAGRTLGPPAQSSPECPCCTQPAHGLLTDPACGGPVCPVSGRVVDPMWALHHGMVRPACVVLDHPWPLHHGPCGQAKGGQPGRRQGPSGQAGGQAGVAADREVVAIVSKTMRRLARQRAKTKACSASPNPESSAGGHAPGSPRSSGPTELAASLEAVMTAVQAKARRVLPAADVLAAMVRRNIEADKWFGQWEEPAAGRGFRFVLRDRPVGGGAAAGAAGGRRGDVVHVVKEVLRARVRRGAVQSVTWLAAMAEAAQGRLATAEAPMASAAVLAAVGQVLWQRAAAGELVLLGGGGDGSFALLTQTDRARRFVESWAWRDTAGEDSQLSSMEPVGLSELVAAEPGLRALLDDTARLPAEGGGLLATDGDGSAPPPAGEGPARGAGEGGVPGLPLLEPPEPLSVAELAAALRGSSELVAVVGGGLGAAVRRLSLAELSARAAAAGLGSSADRVHRTAVLAEFTSPAVAPASTAAPPARPFDAEAAAALHGQQGRRWVAVGGSGEEQAQEVEACEVELTVATYNVLAPSAMAAHGGDGSRLSWPGPTGRLVALLAELDALGSKSDSGGAVAGRAADLLCLQEVESTRRPADLSAVSR